MLPEGVPFHQFNIWGKQIKKVYERSDVSRITTGVRSTVTNGKCKHQKRLPKDTLKNVYKMYITESKSKIGFITFYRLKPFWVVSPRKQIEILVCACFVKTYGLHQGH